MRTDGDPGASLFANWRYVVDREPNPDFILKPRALE
jgi:hypothetical protein